MDKNEDQRITGTGAVNGAVAHHDEAHLTGRSVSEEQKGLYEEVEQLRLEVEHLLDQQKAFRELRNQTIYQPLRRSSTTKATTPTNGIPPAAAVFSSGVLSD